MGLTPIVIAVALASSLEPRLESVERQIKRYGYKDFEMVSALEDSSLTLWVNEVSIDGIAIAIVDGSRRRDKIRAYLELHHFNLRAWDALVACYGNPDCRRTRVFRNGLRGRTRKKVGGPADMFYGAGAPQELRIAQSAGSSPGSIREAQTLGLHLAKILRLFKRGLRGPTEQCGFKYHDEALDIAVRAMEGGQTRRVGKARASLWKQVECAGMLVTMDRSLDREGFRELVRAMSPDVSKRLEAYFDAAELGGADQLANAK